MVSTVAWMFWSGFLLANQDWILYSAVGGTMNYLPCHGRAAGYGPGLVQLIVWGLESGKSVYQIPWQGEATSFALQIGKAVDCALCLIAMVS